NEASPQPPPKEGEQGTVRFTDVTKESKINSSAIGYGLGIAVSDINLDGWPDLYIGNDFHENDYLYINQHNGTFSEENEKRIMHTSQFSMGVDVADANNDGFPEIISMDMLPSDPYILKRSLGEDENDIFYYKISAGYTYQYSRNNLQYNRKNGMFSELGLYAGVYATDWSWAPLWMDFDNDGLKDLFISNGIPKRMNDMDYVNFIYADEMQKKLKEDKLDDKDMSMINKFPEIKIPNKFFKNQKDLKFQDEASGIKNDKPTYSNGAIYADLDNDGDLDVVVNNIDDPVLLYENKSNDKKDKPFCEIKLKGAENNINAIGAKVVMFTPDGIRTYEKNPVKGFESSMEIPLHIGLSATKIDSAFLIWPDNSYQPVQLTAGQPTPSFTYQKGLPAFNYDKIISYHINDTKPIEDITASVKLDYKHQENAFPEFDRDPLVPHMASTEGPALAIADINHDGLEDVFIGSSKTFHNAIYLQQPGGNFLRTRQDDLAKDSMYEDVDAVFTDINNDGNVDLIIASGGNEYYGDDDHMQPLAYLNDGKGHFSKFADAFPNVYGTFSCITPCDFNDDGFMDVFIGSRCVPWEYGQAPRSFLLKNDDHGRFIDIADENANGLAKAGMVSNAVWTDIDKDGDKDLIVCYEWGGIDAYINTKGKFVKQSLTDKNGWWNFITAVDIDNDGDMDLIAGNLGLNSRLTASKEQPVRLYYNDFDNNGKSEQVMTYYLQGKEIPFDNKDELQRRIPTIKKKFLYAEDFAKATLAEIFTKEKLRSSTILTADYFSNAVLINDGHMHFTTQAMPWEAQLAPFRDAVIVDANGDNLPDILLAGNYYENNIQMGRYDADFGTILINRGKDSFSCQPLNGVIIKGQVRKIREINVNNRKAYILARNNDSTVVISFK
ncbi:MAG: VCBS repeat-containing protein, partial [Chitinophagaceae bacterium]